MTETLSAPPRRHFSESLRTGPDGVRRLVTVEPGMCGPGSLLVGRIGDWTWETVSEVCGTDVFNARDPRGRPTYLSFYYYRVKAGPALHPGAIGFGDRLEVLSRVFGFGSESVLTLHRIRRISEGPGGTGPEIPDEDLHGVPDAEGFLAEFYDSPRPDRLYVENFNRWIARSRSDSNVGLVRSSPGDFTHAHLPRLPDRYSPRTPCNEARTRLVFTDLAAAGYAPLGEEFTVLHPVDVTRDVNGAGLLYFASYFSIADGALLRLWRHLGRSDRGFLERVVRDSRICYLGNADVDSTLRLRLRPWRRPDDPSDEAVDVVVEDAATDRTLAVCTFRIRTKENHAAAR